MLVFCHCDIGPGTSGRDHCKNYKNIQLDKSSEGSKADGGKCIFYLPSLIQISSPEKNNEGLDLFLILCAQNFAALKKCDNESQLPWPIPIKY